MERSFTELAARLRAARRAKGLSQITVAREAGCAQSAISMMEQGRADALSGETLRKVALLLGISWEETEPSESSGYTAVASGCAGYRCCPQAECPSNIPFAVGNSVVFWPRRQPAGQGGLYCAYCGEVLLAACAVCGAPLGEGGHCARCGAAYVNQPVLAEMAAAEWAAARRQQLAGWRALF